MPFSRALLRALTIGCIAALAGGCGVTPPAFREDARITDGRRLCDQGKYAEAERHFLELLSVASQRGDSLIMGQSQKWLGNVRLAYGQNTEALGFYEQARRTLELYLAGSAPSADPARDLAADELRNIQNNIAVIYKNRGELDKAEELHRRILEGDRARGEPIQIAVTLYNIGNIDFLRAEAARRAGSDSLKEAQLLRAKRHYTESLATYPTADAYVNLGNAYALEGRPDSAVARFRKAESMYHSLGYRIQRALCLGNIGILLTEQGAPDEAKDAFVAAIAIIEELRGTLSSIDVRSSFISNKYHLYEDLIALLVARGDAEEAFEYAERAKARSFLDLVGNKAVGSAKTKSPEVRRLIEEEAALQSRIGMLVENTDSAAVLDDVIRRHQGVIARLREADPEYASVKSVDPITTKDVQDLLDDSTAVIEYFVGESCSFVFVIRKTGVAVRALAVHGPFGLENRIEILRRRLYFDFPLEKTRVINEAMSKNDLPLKEAMERWRSTPVDGRWQYDLVTMYTQVFAPADSLLRGVRTLYIVPHGALHQLPFQALIRPSGMDRDRSKHIARPRFLIEEYAMAYLPSASVLPFARARRSRTGATAVIVGDPTYADPIYRQKPLASALAEADSVAAFFEHPVVLKRADAEERAVKSAMTAKALIHFATHGELNKREPLRSRILLAAAHPSGDDDGNLTVAEVFNLDLSASLVALSACQTAQALGEEGGFAAGDELVGLTRSFLYAGTPSVVASLWYVDDAATLEWMEAFYTEWIRNSGTKAEAARRAALSILDNPADPDWIFPYYWGAFILFGDTH